MKYCSIYKQNRSLSLQTFKTKKFKKVKGFSVFLNYKLVENDPFKRNAMSSIFLRTFPRKI